MNIEIFKTKTCTYLLLCYVLGEHNAREIVLNMKDPYKFSNNELKQITEYIKQCFAIIKNKTDLKKYCSRKNQYKASCLMLMLFLEGPSEFSIKKLNELLH